MKKKLTAILSLALLLPILLLSGCSSANPLPDSMDQDQVSEVAQQIVTELVAGEYQTVADRFRQDTKETYSVTAETIEAMMDTITKAGDYIATERVLVLGGDKKIQNEDYATALVYCKHDKKAVVYEMSLDVNLELLGLAAKQK